MSNRGFSIIEVIVSLTLFVTVMTIASGSILSLVSTNRISRAEQAIVNNLNFAFEDIAKNLRVGTSYHCAIHTSNGPFDEPQDCVSSKSLLAFEPEYGDPDDPDDQIVYRYQTTGGGGIGAQNGGSGYIEKSIDGGATYERVTSPDINVTAFRVRLTGSSITDALQPQALLLMQGTITTKNQTQTFNLQTTITQRIFDIDPDTPSCEYDDSCPIIE
jgi:prepilin-type N-terminal cleavage/methylation domain-containing protein